MTTQTLLYLALASLFIMFGLIGFVVASSSDRAFGRYKAHSTAQLGKRLSTMFLFHDAKKIFQLRVALFILIPILAYMITANMSLVVLLAIMTAVLPELFMRLLEKRRLETFESGLPDALSQIAGSMKAGATLINAIDTMAEETKGPIGDEFALLIKEHRMGKSFEDAFYALSQRIDSSSIRIVIAASSIANDVGGNLSETFERLATMLAQKKMMEDKIKSLTSQGKLQGWVVGALPVGMIVMISQIQPAFFHYLTASYIGWGFMFAMSLFLLAGGVMIKKIITIDV